jgi:hypothetical protein
VGDLVRFVTGASDSRRGRTEAAHRMRISAVGCLSDERAGRAAIALLVAVARVAALEARDLVCLGLQAIAGDGSVRARYRSGLMMVVELGQIRDVG